MSVRALITPTGENTDIAETWRGPEAVLAQRRAILLRELRMQRRTFHVTAINQELFRPVALAEEMQSQVMRGFIYAACYFDVISAPEMTVLLDYLHRWPARYRKGIKE